MTDANSTQPLPDPEARWVLSTDAAPRRRRKWPWLVVLLVVVALLVAAWFVLEAIARSVVEKVVRDQIVSRLELPEDQQIDVDIAGAVLPQLIVGRFDDVAIASDDVPLEGLSADVAVRAKDIAIRGDMGWTSGTAQVTFDTEQLRGLLSRIEGFPADAVVIDPPQVAFDTQLELFGATFPLGVGLAPRAEGGDLVLTPQTLRLGDAEVAADVLIDQFGALARTVVRDWNICVAEYLPAAVTLTGVRVEGEALVADVDVDSAILGDPAAREPGSCD
jgi:uncharacterized protein YpmS